MTVPYPPAPRWAVRAAHVVVLTALPSGLWRLALAMGFHAGHTGQGYADRIGGATGRTYVVLLSVLTEGCALLTLGLVRPWGEMVPDRVPILGGRAIPPRVVSIIAFAGALILFVLWTPFLLWWTIPDGTLTPTGHTVVGFLYLPLVAWAPLLSVVALDFHRRHQPGRILPA